jgi:uncharacterized MnhB-related membrane protein
MKQNVIQSLIFFVVLFAMKYLFDKSDIKTMITYSVVGAVIFFGYRTFIRPQFLKNKNDQEN